MVILDTQQKGKSVVDENIYISYNIRSNGEGERQEIHGVVFKDESSIGFVSYDYRRSGVQFSLNPENGLGNGETRQVFDVFMEDIEELNSA